jgi:hypothetical protein
MNSFFLSIISAICFLNTAAQDRPTFIISTTKVYTTASAHSKAIGVYARGGSANELEKLPNNWSKIITENGDTGYVPAKFLVRTLNANDDYEKDPADFVSPTDKDAVYGSTHLFVTAASLKARAILAKGKPVVKILRTNQPVGVSYLPYNENGMVKVGGGYYEKETMIFVPKKYLGKRINFTTALSEFNSSNNAAAKKQLAERIYEMSWLENKTNNLAGVQAFRNYAKETGNNSLYNELAFEEFLLKATAQTLDYEAQADLFKKNPLSYTILGKLLPLNFTEKDVQQINLPKKIINNGKDYPECGVEVTKEYRFDNFKVFHSSTEKLTYIPEINFKTSDITVSIAGFKIDYEITETDFIKKMGGLISYTWLDTPHIYILPEPDAAAFVFHFKNGKIEKLEYFFYC